MKIDIQDTTAFIELDEATFKNFLKVGRIIITDTENHVCMVFNLD